MFERRRRKNRNRWRWAGLLFVVRASGGREAGPVARSTRASHWRRGRRSRPVMAKAKVIHQADGNVVFSIRPGPCGRPNERPVTSTLSMQGDGNLVLYGPGDIRSGTRRHTATRGAWLAVQDDCNLVIYSATQSVLWASNKFVAARRRRRRQRTARVSSRKRFLPLSRPGQTATVSVAMRNSGSSTWSPAAQYSPGEPESARQLDLGVRPRLGGRTHSRDAAKAVHLHHHRPQHTWHVHLPVADGSGHR